METGFYRETIPTDCYPYAERPLESLRWCGECGRMTFLAGSCPSCGRADLKRVCERREAEGAIFACVLVFPVAMAGALLSALSGILLGHVVSIAVVCMTGASILWLLKSLNATENADRQAFWRFHTDPKQMFRSDAAVSPVDAVKAEPILDAWFFDMDETERQALAGDWEGALINARLLGHIYRNRRLSLLMLRALLTARQSGADCFDLDDICANLSPEDIGDADVDPFLRLVNNAVREGGLLRDGQIQRLYCALLPRRLTARQGEKDVLPLPPQQKHEVLLTFSAWGKKDPEAYFRELTAMPDWSGEGDD